MPRIIFALKASQVHIPAYKLLGNFVYGYIKYRSSIKTLMSLSMWGNNFLSVEAYIGAAFKRVEASVKANQARSIQ